VTFGSAAQPSPAEPESRETTVLAPSATKVTVLPESLIAAVALMDTDDSSMITIAFETARECTEELPVTLNSSTSTPFAPLQVRLWPESATFAAPMSQTIMKVK
jgi:hypothetical protein